MELEKVQLPFLFLPPFLPSLSFFSFNLFLPSFLFLSFFFFFFFIFCLSAIIFCLKTFMEWDKAYIYNLNARFSSLQLPSHVWLIATPWTAVLQASLSITNSWSSPKLMSIESVMPSNHLILCRPLLLLPSTFPTSGSFLMSQLFASAGQNIGVSASTSVFPMNTQDWSPLGWTAWISLQFKGLSRVFSNTTVQMHQFRRRSAFSPTLTSIHHHWKNHSLD